MIRKVSCPQCGSKSNVPASAASVRCPSCGHVWNTRQSDREEAGGDAGSGSAPANATSARRKSASRSALPIILGSSLIGLVLLAVIGWVVLRSWPDQGQGQTDDGAGNVTASDELAEEAPTDQTPNRSPQEATVEYRVVDLPETTRRQIYADYRRAAGSSVEKRIPLPKDAPARTAMENSMNEVLDREVRRFAAMHDVSESDIRQVVAEGEAKNW